MVTIPVIRDVHLKKTMLGKYVAVHNCPHCQDRLKSREYEIGKPDECPDCGGIFAVSKRVLREIDNEKIQLREEKVRERQRKKEAKEKEQIHKRREQRECQIEAKKKRTSQSLGWTVFAVIGLPLFYVLSPPFVLSFMNHMHDWFGIDSWLGMHFFDLIEYIYYPLESLGSSSESFSRLMHWYIKLFPDWFVWGADGPPFFPGGP